jgi:tetratricopeptide (TPR) repeat protein
MTGRWLVLAVVAVAAGCTPKRVHERPILQNGDRVQPVDAQLATERQIAEQERSAMQARRDSLAATALAECAPAVCAAIARGEVALGMTEAQVLAATRTTENAWNARRAGAATVLVPHSAGHAPKDAVGELAMVQVQNGRVSSYSYRESAGLRVVASAADATTAGRASALADMLIREGDDLAARGRLDEALDRYDRADVLRMNDPELDYRIASVLDKQLRPIEALIRYQLFLHRLELEKIEARGDAYAKMAAAMAHARERIIVLEQHRR